MLMSVKKKALPTPVKAQDAIEMLMADHRKVKKLFSQFDKAGENSKAQKAELVKQICNELTLHAEIEEEIFYPAVRKAIQDGDLMDEALVEHASAKSLIAQLQEMDTGDDLYDAKVTVLGEQIDHHVEEEEGNMFRKARRSKVDTLALGVQMVARKAALKQELDIADDDPAPRTRSPAKRKRA